MNKKPKNLFFHPTMLVSAIGSLMIGGQTVIFDMLDNGISAKNVYQLLCQVSLVLGTGATVHATDEDTYTPGKIMPGRNYVDLNCNNIQDPGEPFIDSPGTTFGDDVW